MQTLFIHRTCKEFIPLVEKNLKFGTKMTKEDGWTYTLNMKQFWKNCKLTATIIRNDTLLIFDYRQENVIMDKNLFGLKPGESFDNFMKDCPDKVICLGLELKVL